MRSAATRLFDPAGRKPRVDHELDGSPGLYALFLRPGSHLPGVQVGSDGLIYIGKADGAGGLAGRCHFKGKTRNHSPRKSLAVLLAQVLKLVPKRVDKSDGSYKTWALDQASEAALDQWMHDNLEVAIIPCSDAATSERLLIAEHSPALNLTDCIQSEGHRRIIGLRKSMEDTLRNGTMK